MCNCLTCVVVFPKRQLLANLFFLCWETFTARRGEGCTTQAMSCRRRQGSRKQLCRSPLLLPPCTSLPRLFCISPQKRPVFRGSREAKAGEEGKKRGLESGTVIVRTSTLNQSEAPERGSGRGVVGVGGGETKSSPPEQMWLLPTL